MPFLSVVIPTYNRCESLRITLEALKRQEPVEGDFEVVVVSDGSTDLTNSLLIGWSAATLPFEVRRSSRTTPVRPVPAIVGSKKPAAR